MPRLALFTSGILIAPRGDPAVQGFWERVFVVFAHAASLPGHLGNAHQARRAEPTQTSFEANWGAWGQYAVPRFTPGVQHPSQIVQTLSLWASLDAARAFAYQGAHLEAMRNRAQWMQPIEGPAYVLWWADDGLTPTWRDACARLEQLYLEGPTPAAFSFKRVFHPEVAGVA